MRALNRRDLYASLSEENALYVERMGIAEAILAAAQLLAVQVTTQNRELPEEDAIRASIRKTWVYRYAPHMETETLEKALNGFLDDPPSGFRPDSGIHEFLRKGLLSAGISWEKNDSLGKPLETGRYIFNLFDDEGNYVNINTEALPGDEAAYGKACGEMAREWNAIRDL